MDNKKTDKHYELRSDRPPAQVDLVVIGVSTGGPDALSVLVAGLVRDFACPILIVQHVQTGMSKGLVHQMQQKTTLKVCEGQSGLIAKAGEIYLAPGGSHMVLRRNIIVSKGGMYEIELTSSEPVNSCRPSVDVFFESVADCTQRNVIAIMMTGMGHDGARGMKKLVETSHAYVLVQDKASSVVWSMPEAVAEQGLANELVPLELIAHRLNRIVMKKG
jgi:two-component system chemotaxis response regulator CheB